MEQNLNKNELLELALYNTLIERHKFIDVDRVLRPFLFELNKITLIGFFTTSSRDKIIEIINQDYRLSSDMFIEGSAEMILDFITMVRINMERVGLDPNDSYLRRIQDVLESKEVLNQDIYSSTFKPVVDDAIMDTLFVIRTKIQYLENTLKRGEVDE